MIMPRYLSAIRSERDTRKKYVRRERGTRIEEDNTVYYSHGPLQCGCIGQPSSFCDEFPFNAMVSKEPLRLGCFYHLRFEGF